MPYKKGSRAMPPVKTPQLLQRCVAGVSERFAGDEGVPVNKGHVSRAFAICTAQGQRYGKYEWATRTLTPRGRGLTSAVREDKRRDLRRYETVLQEARENIHEPTGAAMKTRRNSPSGLMARMENPSWWCPACRMRAGMNPARVASGAMPRVSDTSWWCPACQMRQMSVQPARAYGPSGAVSGPRVAAVAIGGVVLGAAATYWWKKQGG